MRRNDKSDRSTHNRKAQPSVLLNTHIRWRSLRSVLSQLEHTEYLLQAEISRREAAELELERTQAVMAGIDRTFPRSAFVIFDRDLRCISAQGTELGVLGILPGDVLGKTLDELNRPYNALADMLVRSALTGESNLLNTHFRGHIYEIHATALRDTTQQVERILIIAQNVTHLKQATREQAKLASIVEQASIPIITETLDGLVQTWNAAAERLYGYRADEIIGSSKHILIPPERAMEFDVVMSTLREGKRLDQFDTVRIAKDGTLIPCRCSYAPIYDDSGCVVGISSFHYDHRPHLQTANALADCEERFTHLNEHTKTAFWMIDLHAKHTLYVSPQCENILGVTAQDMMQDITAFAQSAYSEDRKLLYYIQEQLASGIASQVKYRIMQPDNTLRWVDLHLFPAQKTGRAIGIAVDITQQQQVQDKLREREQFVTHVAETLPDILYIYDLRESRNVFVNDNIMCILGYTPEQTQAFGNQMLAKTVHPEDFTRLPAHTARLMAQADKDVGTFEYRMRHADGSWRWLYSREMIFQRDAAGFPVQIMGIAEDITERKRMERIESSYHLQQEQQQRMTTFVVQTLQDLRDHLTTTHTSLYVLSKTASSQSPRILGMKDEMNQISALIDQLEHIAKIEGTTTGQRAPTDLSSLLGEVVLATAAKWKNRPHNVREMYPTSAILLVADADLLMQAFAQVMDNAFRYTAEQGTITIRLHKQVLVGTVVEITDTGCGISPQTLAHLHDQFTTPSREYAYNGTGRGLILAQRIIRLHQGRIHIESSEEHGTRVEISFPD